DSHSMRPLVNCQLPTLNLQETVPHNQKVLAGVTSWRLVLGSWTLSESFLEPPLEEQRPHGESSPHRNHQQQVATFQALVVHRTTQRQRNGRGGGIAEPLDVDDDLLFGYSQLRRRRQDDPAVRLMRTT